MSTNITTGSLMAHSETDTDAVARAFIKHIPNNTTIGLTGTLGAGKTRFVQGVAVALGARSEQVTSPTFVICNQYPLEKIIYHLDAYRIQDEDEFFELGVDEMFSSDGYVFIEWAEKFAKMMPRERIIVTIDVLSATSRRFHFNGTPKYQQAIKQLLLDCIDLQG
ncbi:tRNA (adenosine(37)-N6)-threonylcarbamoyltransferase complex ATPase subunit type 1 TsaE [Pirellulaceae bacterium]|nr:tRNA (adenosine(37)-N6)-threonylcarbamoyltransferase complex ATPase subunit type 1 TsaE [Pirellulaceae bacterium]